MPGNKSVFNDALKKANGYAWDNDWARAVAEYRRALAEYPDDTNTHTSLAHALEAAGQLEGALHEARIASKLIPHDPVPLTRVAVLQEKLNRASEAASTYLAVAEIHAAHKAMGKATEAWQKVAALEPDRTDVRQKLADAYQLGAHNSLAAKEFMALARNYQKRGDAAKALAAAQKAQALDPQSSLARDLLAALGRGEVIQDSRARADVADTGSTPVDAAEQTALSRLAETLLEERPAGSKADAETIQGATGLSEPDVHALIARAVDAQTHHRVGEAIEAYRDLIAAGVARPEVKFNLGLLYSETMRYDEAISFLTATADDSNYALASHFELGKCFRALGKTDQALEHFLQVTQIVDLSSVQREQADELISVYQGLAETYAAKGDRDKAESFSRSLEEFLSGRGWEDKVREVRLQLQALREEGEQVSLAELIEVSESASVLEALALAKDYLRRGKLNAAHEECMRAIELAPNYFPAHVRLAEILVKENKPEAAKAKYQTLAELSAIRGDLPRAETYYRRLIRLFPNNVTDRSKLIDLLTKQGRTDSALEEYLELGNEYARDGQFAKAAERFSEGMRLATRAGITSAPANQLRQQLANARAQQGDLKAALAVYQEIARETPGDERARVLVIDLEFRLEQTAAGLRDLEELLTYFRAQGANQKIGGVLEGLAKSYSREPALRALLAQHYLTTGNPAKAIVELDALGEMQLNAGQKPAAAATIRQIIALNPPQVDGYKKVLAQIGE
ncbi:MAG: tetratricopeptide repeat protein [Chloroflexi bacterium]|nr:tetratricopeptide repeat protein [Chloroflexota bacterium]